MLTIVQRGGATREKPPEVVRGVASRLPWAWDGLCFAVPFNAATQDSARDIVTNAAPSLVSGLSWTRDNRGNTAASFTTTSYMNYADNPQNNQPTTAITVYVRIRRSAAADLSGGIFGKVYGTSDPFLSWALYDNDDTPGAIQGHLNIPEMGAYLNIRDPYVVPTDQWVSVFLRWVTGIGARIDLLGERGETLSVTDRWGLPFTGSIAYSGTGQPIGINRSDSATQNAAMDYSQAMLWSRRLTDTELQAIVSDPYGWYSPRRETVGLSSPYPLAFGGGEMRHGTGIGGLR